MFGAFLGKAAALLASGLAGAAVYDGAKKGTKIVLDSGVAHGAAVTVTSWGLRSVRAAEAGAEKARLATADIVAEAHERLGQQAPVPGTDAEAAHGHGH
jgi:hypothetical protein